MIAASSTFSAMTLSDILEQLSKDFEAWEVEKGGTSSPTSSENSSRSPHLMILNTPPTLP